jgi:hypothetical protein
MRFPCQMLALAVLLSTACAGKSADEDDADSGSSADGGAAWWVAPGGATYSRASDGAAAWQVSAGVCTPGAGGLTCTHELELTGPVGRNCPDCSDQSLTVGTAWGADSSARVESAELHAGDGMPLGVALSGLGLGLLPPGPWAVGSPVAVGADVPLPDEVVPVFARFILLSDGGAFTRSDGRTFSDCTLFAYAGADRGVVLAIAAACSGEGVVQIAFPQSELEALDSVAPFAGVNDRRLFVRD